jgi:hypothetical protein
MASAKRARETMEAANRVADARHAREAKAQRDELVAAVLLWAKTPGNHDGNPYFQDFVRIARRIAGDE